MKYIYVTIAICFLNFSLQGKGTYEVASDNNKNIVQFELVAGLILVPLIVDGVQGTYILDSGAPSLTLNRKVDKAEFTLVTLGRTHEGQAIFVDGIQYGDISKEDIEAWAMDLSFIEQILNRPISGILGADLFNEFDILIDFDSGEIQLITAETRRLSLETSSYHTTLLKINGFHDELPLVNVSISGSSHSMIFDTGAAISVLDERNSSSSLEQSNKEIKLCNVKINEAPFLNADLSDLKNDKEDPFDGILSVSSLNASKVLLSYSSSRVYLFWSKSTT